MRNPVRSGFVFLCVLLAGAAIAAQPQVVTKATAPSANAPKAFAFPGGPDAEALLLADRYTLRADGAVVHERTLRMKVNSSLAINRDFGESRIVWDPAVETFEVLHNRTVRPSGEVVEGPANAIVDELPPAVHRNPLWSRLRRRVIVHTALEPGAVIEASWRVTRAASTQAGMTVAEPLAFAFPVAQRLVEVEAPAGVELVASAAAEGGPAAECTTTGASRTCRWRRESVAALPAEPGTPARVEFEPYALAAAGSPAGKGWAADELQRRWDAAGPVPAGAIEAVRKAVGSEPDRERALLAALTALSDAINVSGALTRTDWTDWAAAVRVGARHVKARAGDGAPFHIVGYSNGGALAVDYALDVLDGAKLPKADRLVLVSPMIGVGRAAGFARVFGLLGVFPYFETSRWLDVMPEYIPFKYVSFPVNAATQTAALTEAIRAKTTRAVKTRTIGGLPPILTFVSLVDATVRTDSTVRDLYDRLGSNGSELVVFDVNRSSVVRPFLRRREEGRLDRLLPRRPRPYRLTVVTNAAAGTREVVERNVAAGREDAGVRPLDAGPDPRRGSVGRGGSVASTALKMGSGVITMPAPPPNGASSTLRCTPVV